MASGLFMVPAWRAHGIGRQGAVGSVFTMTESGDLVLRAVTESDLDTLFELSTRIAVVADKRVVVHAAPSEVVRFDHPFVREYFLGGRGQRASVLLRQGGRGE